ncbi:MAG: hypothetical protein ACLR3C_10020 [Eggerthella lenta]
METLVLNGSYDRMEQRGGMDDEAREWLHEKRAEADAALANIDQRRQTLHRFGVYLAEVQYDFFMGGEARMRPLTMQQAADALGVQCPPSAARCRTSTPSPRGACSRSSTSSQVRSPARPRSAAMRCRRLPSKTASKTGGFRGRRTPLSDATITAILNGEGVDIKRRTVAKYREALGIGRQSQRRR